MDTLNSNPEAAGEPVPAPAPAPAAPVPTASVPEAVAAPVPTASVPEAVAAPVTPSAAPVSVSAPAPAPAPAPAAPAAPPAFRGVVPNTSAKTVGGWNRFAGYDPKAAKAKQNNNRGGSRGGR